MELFWTLVFFAFATSITPGGVIFSPTAVAGSAQYRNFIRLNCAIGQDARLERALQTLGLLCRHQLSR